MPVTPEPVLLKPRVEEFLTFCGARNLSSNTIRAYRRDLSDFVALAGGSEISVSQVNRKLVRGFTIQLYECGIKRSSIVRKIAAVKSFCKWLEAEGLVDASLLVSLSAPRRRYELPDVPNESDVKQLVEGEIPTACPERDRVILELLYGSGLRAAELVGINVDDFRDKDVLLVRGKGRKERFVIIGEYAQAAIKAWLPVRASLLLKMNVETPALMFSVGPRRSYAEIERLEVRSVGRVVKAIAEAKGLDPGKWHPHLLRPCLRHPHARSRRTLASCCDASGARTAIDCTDLHPSLSWANDADLQQGAPACERLRDSYRPAGLKVPLTARLPRG